ncbi:nuclear transport factor 2 family protein [Cryptosporangium sp. NPDC051539]|uniref:nuclear transport factor 2 family protein n=1 Tax=Cryptosporangium sp. NPDC051539 TaxID=3363962 RepID=UPI0037A25078
MIESEFITWNAPDGENPARAASQRSYDAVGRKAKDEWLRLFTDDALLEDPVGPSFFDPEGKGHRGAHGIGAFWDTVIAPVKRFHFTVHDSFANSVHCANVATFSTELDDGTLADTELVSVYRLDGSGRIELMRAYWEVERTLASIRKP